MDQWTLIVGYEHDEPAGDAVTGPYDWHKGQSIFAAEGQAEQATGGDETLRDSLLGGAAGCRVHFHQDG
jgi:hypothetical protein